MVLLVEYVGGGNVCQVRYGIDLSNALGERRGQCDVDMILVACATLLLRLQYLVMRRYLHNVRCLLSYVINSV